MATKKTAEDLVERVVVTVHGIRTFGQWQQRLTDLVKAAVPNATVYNYHYGFFSVLAFLVPPLRAIRVRFFRTSLEGILKRHPEAQITLVGHSFGTHMIGWAIAKGFASSGQTFEQVILAGSVLRQDYDWQKLIDSGVVRRVINGCGVQDSILLLSQFGVLFTGMAGRLGFSGATGVALFNRYFQGGHSHYFVDDKGLADDTFMKKYWLPLIIGTEKPSHIDMRTTPGPVGGFLLWLIQNADGMKIAALVAIAVLGWQQLYAGPRREVEGEKMERLRVVAMQQLNNDESVPQGVATLLAIALKNPDDTDAFNIASWWLPQLVDLQTIMRIRGMPAFVEWNGRNLLLVSGKTISLGGDAAVSHGFTRDRQYLLTFDAGNAINIYETATGKRLLTVSTRLSGADSDDEGPEVEQETDNGAAPAVVQGQDDLTSAYQAGWESVNDGVGRLPSLVPQSEAGFLTFRESRDGRLIWAHGRSMSASAGSSMPILFLFDRQSSAWSLCEFTDAELGSFDEGGKVRFFLKEFGSEAYYEIAMPETGKRCRYKDINSAGRVEPVGAATAARISASAMSGVGIATSAWLDKPGQDYDAAAAAGTASLVFPRLLPNISLWSRVPHPAGDIGSLGFGSGRNLRGSRLITEAEGKKQRQQLRNYAASPAGQDVADDIGYALGGGDQGSLGSDVPDRGTVVVSESTDSVITFVEGGGNTYSTTVYCLSKRIGAPIKYCDGINVFGDSQSVAISPGNRYVAGADIPMRSRPGVHLHDTKLRSEILLDRQPQGGTDWVAFDSTGTKVFAATPLGVWAYALPGDGSARFERLYRISGLAARHNEDELISSSIAVGPTQIYHLTDSGLLQAISRTNGNVDWIQQLQLTSPKMAYDEATGQLAVHDEKCAHLIHAKTGARLTSPFCPDWRVGQQETARDENSNEVENAGVALDAVQNNETMIQGIRFSADHVLEVWTSDSIFRFDQVVSVQLAHKPPQSLFGRIRQWFGVSNEPYAENELALWRDRTGYDVSNLPASPRTVLDPRQEAKQADGKR